MESVVRRSLCTLLLLLMGCSQPGIITPTSDLPSTPDKITRVTAEPTSSPAIDQIPYPYPPPPKSTPAAQAPYPLSTPTVSTELTTTNTPTVAAVVATPTTPLIITPPSLPSPPVRPWPDEGAISLPAPLYYLSPRFGDTQIWRVEASNLQLTQVTFMLEPVQRYDVSSSSGNLAFVSGNRLWVADAMGGDLKEVNTKELRFEEQLTEAVATLAWAPDGSSVVLAGQDGLWRYALETDQLDQLLSLPADIFAYWLSGPQPWSPDGSYLVMQRGYQGSDAADGITYSLAQDLVIEGPDGVRCGKSTWSADGESVYISQEFSNSFCAAPGLVRINLESGAKERLISSEMVEGMLIGLGKYVHTAQEGPDGRLYYFYDAASIIADMYQTGNMIMHRSNLDGTTAREALRSDRYAEVLEVLWAPDMSSAIIVDGADPETFNDFRITLLTIENQPAKVLVDEGIALRWGKGE